MKKDFLIKKLPLFLIVSGLVVTAAIAQTSAGKGSGKGADTIPTKQKKIRDLDEALAELDRGEAEMAKALKEIDFQKMEREIRASLKEIDMEKIKADVDKTLKEIDVEKMTAEVDKALKEIDIEKIRADVRQSLKEIDMEKIKAEVSKIKDVDIARLKIEMEKLKPEIEKSIQEAKKDIEKARIEITSYKNLVNALDKDGLLKKSEDYKIEYKNGEMTVNGKKLSDDAVKKYSEFLTDKDGFTIEKEAGDFNIHHK